jgi:hypothetical protein
MAMELLAAVLLPPLLLQVGCCQVKSLVRISFSENARQESSDYMEL